MMGRGTLVESMKYRDEEHGGLAYYFDKDGYCVPAKHTDHAGPNGEKIWHNGMILDGVKEDGSVNDQIISSDLWYNWTYNWGVGDPTYYGHAVFKNTYVKCRELTLTYALPEKLTKGWCQGLKVSVFARNPFYLYKNLPIWDAENSDSTGWAYQVFLEGSTNATRTFGASLRVNF